MANEELMGILKKYGYRKKYKISQIDYSYVFSIVDLKKLNYLYISNLKDGISDDLIVNDFKQSYIEEIIYICEKIIQNNSITRNEEYIFETFITSRFLVNLNLEKFNSVIDEYVNNYLCKKNNEYNTRKLVLLTYYLLALTKSEYTNVCQVGIENVRLENNNFEMAASILNSNHYIICVNDLFPEDLDTKWSQGEFNSQLIRICFCILHEKEHIRQFVKLFNGETDNENERWKKEIVLTYNRDFYTKYGLNFDIEAKANEYAFNNVLDYCRMLIGHNPKIEKKFLKQFKEKTKKVISDKEFNILMNDTYDKFVEENPSYLERVNSFFRKDTDAKVLKK